MKSMYLQLPNASSPDCHGLMRDRIFMLSTHGWGKALEEDNDMSAIDRLVQRFTIKLQGAGADTEKVV